MHIAVGVDVGYSANRQSTASVILDRDTKRVAKGSELRVGNTSQVVEFVLAEIDRLQPVNVAAVVDGPFACATPPAKARSIERFFGSGPFASMPPKGGARLRLMPGPTAAGSTFLASTRTVVDALVSVGHSEAVLSGSTVAGSTIEIFPTIFMAALLPPHEYVGKRGEHTDDLWLKLIGAAPVDEVAAPRPVLAPYGTVIAAVEQSPWGDRHELRAAAISAIAADWFGGFPPGAGGATASVYIMHPTEGGFLMPPRPFCDPQFLAMIDAHRATSEIQNLILF
jgi:hypothetical protein